MIYFDRLQAGLRSAIASVLPSSTVVWAPSQLIREVASSSLIALRRLGSNEDPDPSAPRVLPTTTTITVADNPAIARAVTIYATGARWRVFIAGGATTEEFRDAVIEALTAAGHSLHADLTPVNDDGISIVGDRLDALHGLAVRGHATLTVNASTLARVTTGTAISRVEIQAYSRSRYPYQGAHAMVSTIKGVLRGAAIVELFDRHGLALHGAGQVVDLTALSGPDWESRAACDLMIAQRSFAAEAITAAASAAADVSIGGTNYQTEVTP